MAMNPFPPQAYTRETLIKAYQWLQSQSPQVREVATTPDLLISLFQKAQMQGKDSLERPTLQNFKNELRSLAGMMGEFDDGQTPPAAHPHAPQGHGASTSSATMPAGTQMPLMAQPNPQPPPVAPRPQMPPPHGEVTQHPHVHQAMSPRREPMPSPEPAYLPSAPAQAGSYSPNLPQAGPASVPRRAVADGVSIALDSKSLEWLEEIQRELNLESPAEALRLALSVGYGRLADLFPKRR